MYAKLIKPLLDILITLVALILLSPIILLLLIILTINNNGTPFFLQKRGGENGSIFKIIKFKTMTDQKDSNGELLPDEQRLTKVGDFVRRSSLDELPQLFNVIKGDMSLIGPRPFLAEYLTIYNDYQKRRLEVKPGITGWAQVNGRSNLSFSQKFEYDIWYIENMSFLIDLKIFFLTLYKIFKALDTKEQDKVSNVKFNGKN